MDLVNSIRPVPTSTLLLLPCSETSILEKRNSDAVEDDSVADEIVEFPNEAGTAVFELLLADHHPWSFTDDNFNPGPGPGGKRQQSNWSDDFALDADIMNL